MSVNFGVLAGNAFMCPLCVVFGHVGLNKMCRNETACGVDAWMANGVNVMENLLLELNGNEWTKCFCGHVTQTQKWQKWNGLDVEKWQSLQCKDGWHVCCALAMSV
jgi:hypothetical protein